MSAKEYLCAAALVSLVAIARANDNSVEVTLEDGPKQQPPLTDAAVARFKEWQSKDLPAIMKAAATRGEAAARKDIKAGHFRLRDCGEPVGKQDTDSITGYRIARIGPCEKLTIQAEAEARAYNRTMLKWRETHPKRHE